MKAALLSLLAATLLGFASLVGGRPFDAATFTSLLFAAGLAAWTVEQYGRTPRPLSLVRPLRLPVPRGFRQPALPAGRLVA